MTPHTDAAGRSRAVAGHSPAQGGGADHPPVPPTPERDEGGWATSLDLSPPRFWIKLLAYATLAGWLASEWLWSG